jgi:hypothetical protein
LVPKGFIFGGAKIAICFEYQAAAGRFDNKFQGAIVLKIFTLSQGSADISPVI